MRYLISLVLLTFSFALYSNDYSFSASEKIEIDNRVLLKINGHAITVMDLVRKMDLMFFRQYPEYSGSDAARFQFYTGSWQPILEMVIDEELMLLDAEEKKVTTSDGEVRKEMEMLFGPEVVRTLDRINLTFDTAFDLIHRELTVQKMTGAFVHSKVMADIYPQKMKERYQQIIAEMVPENIWRYRYLSIRPDGVKEMDSAVLERVANDLFLEIQQKSLTLEEAVKKLQQLDGIKASLSENFERKEGDLSSNHFNILKKMKVGELSLPIQESNRGATVIRLFALVDFEEGRLPLFSEIESQLKTQMMQESFALHGAAYKKKLREYYGISEQYLAERIPKNLKPFAMQ